MNSSKRGDFLANYTPSLRQCLGALAALCALCLLSRWRAALHLNTHFLGGVYGDGGLYIWLVEQGWPHLFKLPWFNTQAFYPYGLSLGWSDNFILPAVVALPWLKLGLSTQLVYNSTLLCAAILNGFCTFRLCHRLHGNFAAALGCGAVLMLLSNLTNNIGHPQLQFLFWIALALELLLVFLAARSMLSALFIGLCISACFLTTVYYALFTLLLVGMFCLCAALLRPAVATRRNALTLAAGMLLGTLPLVPFVVPYLQVRKAFGARGIYEAYYFSADALSYLSAPALSLLYSFSAAWSEPEAYLFPGIGIIALAFVGLSQLGGTKKLRAHLWAFVLAAVLMLVASCRPFAPVWSRLICAASMWGALLALGSMIYRIGVLERSLGFEIMTKRALKGCIVGCAFTFVCLSFGPLGNPEKGHWALGLFSLLYELVPGFDSIRAISRAGIVALFLLCVLASMALADLAKQKVALKTYLIPLVCIFMLVENVQLYYPLEEREARPLALQKLLSEPAAGAIVGLPLTKSFGPSGEVKSWTEFAAMNIRFMHWFSVLDLPCVNGYSGQRSKLMLELPAQTAGFPDQRSLDALSAIGGLRYVLYASSFSAVYDPDLFKLSLERHKDQLKLLDADQSGNYLFEFVPRLKAGEELLLPSYPSGDAQIELIVDPKTKHDSANISIEASGQVIAQQQIELKTEAPAVSIRVPPIDGPVRPARLKLNGDAVLGLGRVTFVPAH